MRSLIIISFKDSHPNKNVQGLLVYDDEDRIIEAYMHDNLETAEYDALKFTPAVLTSDTKKDLDGVRETIDMLKASSGMQQVDPWQISTIGVAGMVERFRKKHT